MLYLGIDLAWGQVNATGVAALRDDGRLADAGLRTGVAALVDWVASFPDPDVLCFVDAPLVVTNPTGQRPCETEVGRRYGRWKVSANSSNTALPHRAGVDLRAALSRGWGVHDGLDGPPSGGRWLAECYPYTTLVAAAEFGCPPERPAYKRRPRAVAAADWPVLRAATLDRLVGCLAGLAGADPPLRLDTHPAAAALRASPGPLGAGEHKRREDLFDALVCAWTAALWHRHGTRRCQVLGPGPDPTRPGATIIAPTRPGAG